MQDKHKKASTQQCKTSQDQDNSMVLDEIMSALCCPASCHCIVLTYAPRAHGHPPIAITGGDV
jgi:hypothetical protein